MQLHLWAGAARQSVREQGQSRAQASVQRALVQRLERAVHQPREQAFDEDAAADREAHEITDRAVLAERDEGAEVAVDVRAQRLSTNPALDLFEHMRRLLVRRLGARRNRRGFPGTGTGGAVAHGKYVGIA